MNLVEKTLRQQSSQVVELLMWADFNQAYYENGEQEEQKDLKTCLRYRQSLEKNFLYWVNMERDPEGI